MDDQPEPKPETTNEHVVAAIQLAAKAIGLKFERQGGWNVPELVTLIYVQQKNIEVLNSLLVRAKVISPSDFNSVLVAGIEEMTKEVASTTPSLLAAVPKLRN